MSDFTPEIQQQLLAPFPEAEISFLPRHIRGGRALALPYIDSRSVMRRLDAVVGPGNWSFNFEPLNANCTAVKGELCVLGVTKADAGQSSDEGEPIKAAVSDALKRCGVHFGIARYLYYLAAIWADYDAEKSRFADSAHIDPADLTRALALCGYHGELPAAPAEKKPAPRPTKPKRTTKPQSAPAAKTDQQWQCSGRNCSRVLSKAQRDLSIRAYGKALCPTCQRRARRTSASS